MPISVNQARVKAERRKRGWSQEDLAAASRISARTVQRLERGGTATLSSLAATPALSMDALTIHKSAVRRITPLTILSDIAPSLDRFRRMGCGVMETDDPGCVGVFAGGGYQLLCSDRFMTRDYPTDLIATLVGKTILYIWVSSLEIATASWGEVAHSVVTRHGTREALVRASNEWAILAETIV